MKLIHLFSVLTICAFASCATALTVTSETHPNHVFYGFPKETIPFNAFALPGGVPSGARFEVEEGVLQITNAHAGSFGVDTKIPAFDAARFGHVYFDYKLAPSVKVNIFFRYKGVYHAAIFSGPDRVRPGGVKLGHVEGVSPDEKWHRAHIPLRDWMRRLYPLEDQLRIDEIIIGNWDNEEFLMAGVGGNGPGAQWSLDNFAIVAAGPREAKLQIGGAAGAVEWSLNGSAPAATGAALTVSAADGFHLLQLQENNGTAVSFPLLVATTAPAIGAPRIEGNQLLVPIKAPAGLQTRGLALKVGAREFDLSSPFLEWDGAAGVLRLAAGRAGLVWKNGERVPVAIAEARDLNGQTTSHSSSVTLDFARYKEKPPLPRLLMEDDSPLPHDTFEKDVDGWQRKDEDGAYVERDASTAVSGDSSLRLTNPANAAMFGVWARRKGFDAARYPIVSFHYKIPPVVRVDFQVSIFGRLYTIGLTDGPQANRRIAPPPRLGVVPNVKADNQWHRGEFNLLELLKKLKADAPSYQIDSLAISDAGWPGNFSGARYWLDDFQLAPAVNGEMKARVALDDITGVSAVSWVLDGNEDTAPPTTATSKSTLLTLKGEGRRWLHLRAQNGAGQWSDPIHILLVFSS